MKFREHRGTHEDSMKTAVEVENFDALVAHIQKIAAPWGVHVEPLSVQVKPYIGETHIVTINGYGVFGFTDGPALPQDEVALAKLHGSIDAD